MFMRDHGDKVISVTQFPSTGEPSETSSHDHNLGVTAIPAACLPQAPKRNRSRALLARKGAMRSGIAPFR
ncbi:hypothetical protein GA0004734_00043920 [Rhizobium sp. 9140]|nr:hypothetical protein GA0004734_00043920 [Rhizobium sp. 9140]